MPPLDVGSHDDSVTAVSPGQVVLVFFNHIGRRDRAVGGIPNPREVDEAKKRKGFIAGERLKVRDTKTLREAVGTRTLFAVGLIEITLEADPRLVQKARAERMGPPHDGILASKLDRIPKPRDARETQRGVLYEGLSK